MLYTLLYQRVSPSACGGRDPRDRNAGNGDSSARTGSLFTVAEECLATKFCRVRPSKVSNHVDEKMNRHTTLIKQHALLMRHGYVTN